LALIIGGKFLYVVDNRENIKTGVICAYVSNYSKEEISAMQKAIAQKR